jgi:hypothetical protein
MATCCGGENGQVLRSSDGYATNHLRRSNRLSLQKKKYLEMSLSWCGNVPGSESLTLKRGVPTRRHGKACELTSWKEPYFVDSLAAAYAEYGQFDETTSWQKKAVESPAFEKKAGKDAGKHLKLHEQRKPYREP